MVLPDEIVAAMKGEQVGSKVLAHLKLLGTKGSVSSNMLASMSRSSSELMSCTQAQYLDVYGNDWAPRAVPALDLRRTLIGQVSSLAHIRDTLVGREWKLATGGIEWGVPGWKEPKHIVLQPAVAATAGGLTDANVIAATERIKSMFPLAGAPADNVNIVARAQISTAVNRPYEVTRYAWRFAVLWVAKRYAEQTGTKVRTRNRASATKVCYVSRAADWTVLLSGPEQNWLAYAGSASSMMTANQELSVLALVAATTPLLMLTDGTKLPTVLENWPPIAEASVLFVTAANALQADSFEDLSSSDIWTIACEWCEQNCGTDLLVESIHAVVALMFSPEKKKIAPYYQSDVVVRLPVCDARSCILVPLAVRSLERGEIAILRDPPVFKTLCYESALSMMALNLGMRQYFYEQGVGFSATLTSPSFPRIAALVHTAAATQVAGAMVGSMSVLKELSIDIKPGRMIASCVATTEGVRHVADWYNAAKTLVWEELLPYVDKVPSNCALLQELSPAVLDAPTGVVMGKWYAPHVVSATSKPIEAAQSFGGTAGLDFAVEYAVVEKHLLHHERVPLARRYTGRVSDWWFGNPISIGMTNIRVTMRFSDMKTMLERNAQNKLMQSLIWYVNAEVVPQGSLTVVTNLQPPPMRWDIKPTEGGCPPSGMGGGGAGGGGGPPSSDIPPPPPPRNEECCDAPSEASETPDRDDADSSEDSDSGGSDKSGPSGPPPGPDEVREAAERRAAERRRRREAEELEEKTIPAMTAYGGFIVERLPEGATPLAKQTREAVVKLFQMQARMQLGQTDMRATTTDHWHELIDVFSRCRWVPLLKELRPPHRAPLMKAVTETFGKLCQFNEVPPGLLNGMALQLARMRTRTAAIEANSCVMLSEVGKQWTEIAEDNHKKDLANWKALSASGQTRGLTPPPIDAPWDSISRKFVAKQMLNMSSLADMNHAEAMLEAGIPLAQGVESKLPKKAKEPFIGHIGQYIGRIVTGAAPAVKQTEDEILSDIIWSQLGPEHVGRVIEPQTLVELQSVFGATVPKKLMDLVAEHNVKVNKVPVVSAVDRLRSEWNLKPEVVRPVVEEQAGQMQVVRMMVEQMRRDRQGEGKPIDAEYLEKMLELTHLEAPPTALLEAIIQHNNAVIGSGNWLRADFRVPLGDWDASLRDIVSSWLDEAYKNIQDSAQQQAPIADPTTALTDSNANSMAETATGSTVAELLQPIDSVLIGDTGEGGMQTTSAAMPELEVAGVPEIAQDFGVGGSGNGLSQPELPVTAATTVGGVSLMPGQAEELTFRGT